MSLSIVIVSWNTRNLLATCLASVYAHIPDGDPEVFVVDNASSDGSAAMIRERFPTVRLIENRDNAGFACANNQALRQATGEYVLLLNPDTLIQPGALDTLLAFMDGHPRVGAVGPRVLNPDGTLQESCFPAPTLSREGWRLCHLDRLAAYSRYDMARWDWVTPRAVDTLLGACVLVRRVALMEVGLLDETFFMYSEEVDFCRRLAQAGWPLVWVPQATLVHYGGQSARQVPAESFLRLYRGKVLYFRKHHGRLGARLYKGILLSAALGRLAATPLAQLATGRDRAHLQHVAANYRRLLRALPAL